MKFLLIVLFSANLFAQEVIEAPAEEKSNFGFSPTIIKDKFKVLDTKDSTLFQESLVKIESELNEYFQEKRKQCSGEFKFVEFDEEGNKKEESKKLSREEKKVCLYELKKNQTLFIQELISSKKKFFKLRYKENVVELNKLKEKMIGDLEKSYQKRSRSRKRRR